MKSSRVLRLTLLAIPLLAFTGCGGDGIQYVEVEGTVQQDGKPLERILVEFWPEGNGSRSIGETDANGHFVLATDDGKRKGASVGSHKVILKDSALHGDKFLGRAGEHVDMSQGRKPRISDKLANPETTSLSQKVEAGKKNSVTIEAAKK